jgi:hypothetical protein
VASTSGKLTFGLEHKLLMALLTQSELILGAQRHWYLALWVLNFLVFIRIFNANSVFSRLVSKAVLPYAIPTYDQYDC